MDKLIIFGAGNYGKKAYEKLQYKDIAFYVDNNTGLRGKTLYDIKILDFDTYKTIAQEYSLIIGLSENREKELMEQLFQNEIKDFVLYSEIDDYLSGKICLNSELREKHLMSLLEYYKKKEIILEKKNKILMNNVDIRHLKPARGYIRKIQLKMLSFAQDIFSDLPNEIHPFLVAENVLGYTRNNGFIPWGDDIDFMMLRKEYERMMEFYKNKGLFYSSDAPYYDENTLYSEMSDFLNECGNDYAFCSNGKFVKVFFKRTPEPIVLDIFPIDYYNDDISFEQLQNIDMQLKKEFDSNTDKSAVKRDKWYKAIRSSGKIVSKMESSHLCYGLETDFIKMCNSYFSLNYVLPLKKINFENKVFLGPGNPDKMLEMEYGDYMQWPNDAGSTAHGANRRFSRYKNYSNPRYIHTKSEAEDFCKEINEKAGDYQLIVEKYKIFNWKEYFDIVDYLDEHDISYIVYA